MEHGHVKKAKVCVRSMCMVSYRELVSKCSDVLSYFRKYLKKIFLASWNPHRRLVPLYVYSLGVGGSKQNAISLLMQFLMVFT